MESGAKLPLPAGEGRGEGEMPGNILQQLNAEMTGLVARVRASLVRITNGASGAGAGTIWNSEGLIVTNAHVVHQDRPRVTLPDGRTLEAGVAGYDAERDLALLSVKAHGLPTLPIIFISGHGETAVDRAQLLDTLRCYLEANNLHADWDRINSATNERLVNTLAILSPYGPEEKQALLEAKGLQERAEALVALAEMELAARDDGSGTSVQ